MHTHTVDTFQTDSLTVRLASMSFLFLLIVNIENAEITVWAFEP